MRVHSLGEGFFENIKRYGLPRTLSDVTIRAINHVTFFKILKSVHIEVPDPAFLDLEDRYQYGFLDKAALFRYCNREEHDLEEHHLSEEFLERALARGDQCFGIRERDVLVSYGWYSNKATEISEDLKLNFGTGYVYMYKGFTRADYRGQRLHAIGMTMALKEYLGWGFRGLISYVESNNFSSLKSVYRMGYRDCGDIYVLRVFGSYLIHATSGCKAYGLTLETVQNGAGRSSPYNVKA